jgi:hypothetical protein
LFQEADVDSCSDASSPIHFPHGNGASARLAINDLGEAVRDDPTAFMTTDETAQFEADKRKIYK